MVLGGAWSRGVHVPRGLHGPGGCMVPGGMVPRECALSRGVHGRGGAWSGGWCMVPGGTPRKIILYLALCQFLRHFTEVRTGKVILYEILVVRKH